MKIGILTFHRSYNYGAFMQCFSLYTRLKNDFPMADIEIIDYTSKRAMEGYDREILNITNKEMQAKIKARNESFKETQKRLPLSDFRILSDDIDEVTNRMNDIYDIIIVGSDAVWNWNVRGFPSLYFLKDYNGKKLSYAASVHGMNYQNMTEEQRLYVSEALADFNYLGVRDITTENMVNFANDKLKAYHNCDPTMFLDLKAVPCDMDKLKQKMINHGVDFSKPLIGIMAGNSIGREIRSEYRGKAQLVSLYTPNKYADVFLYDLTPYEWAHVFSFFKVTVTHFFHGTMLSLVNRIPVIPVESINEFSASNTTKIKDLMNRMELSDWRFELDHRGDLLKRALYHYGVLNDKCLWKKVINRINMCMERDFSTFIDKKVIKEQASYDTFCKALEKYIGEDK